MAKNRAMAIKHAKAKRCAIEAKKFRDYDMMCLGDKPKEYVRPMIFNRDKIEKRREEAMQNKDWFAVVMLNKLC